MEVGINGSDQNGNLNANLQRNSDMETAKFMVEKRSKILNYLL